MKLITTFLFIVVIPHVYTSNGDRSMYYQQCLKLCKTENCARSDSKDDLLLFSEKAVQSLTLSSWLLGWGCVDECKYICMWTTVAWAQNNNYGVPKFHGKWPFYRFFGVQEPAAAFFSLLNLLAHVQMFKKLNKKLLQFDAPFKICWRIFAMVCINAWTWSTIFHTRDTPFTEFMDYACALSMVIAFCAAAVVRILYHNWHPYSALVVLCPAFLYYFYHVAYLWTGDVDYNYNMIVNVLFGMVSGFLWLGCSFWWWWCIGVNHAWRAVAFTLLNGALLTLELIDLYPVLGVLDTHALWHLSTAPLPYLFYRYLIDDIDYIITSKKKTKEV